jgi:hypothetical protein
MKDELDDGYEAARALARAPRAAAAPMASDISDERMLPWNAQLFDDDKNPPVRDSALCC